MLTLRQKKILRFLQNDLPLKHAPYRGLARRLGTDEPRIIAEIRRLKQKGYIRRFGALLNHYTIGLKENCLCVWNVPRHRMARFVSTAVRQPQVSHCYQRNPARRWPYNLYTMIHGHTKQECLRVIKTIAVKSAERDYRMLFTIRELKKVSPKYQF